MVKCLGCGKEVLTRPLKTENGFDYYKCENCLTAFKLRKDEELYAS